MPFLDTNRLPVIERLPGWHGRYFHSQNMTFAHYDFASGSSIHEHFHPEEEVYEVIVCREDAKASCCAKDEGRPFGAAWWEDASNSHELLRTKAAVLNVTV